MPAFMLQLKLMPFTNEMMETIPEHRARIDKLISDGRILSYSVSAQRNHIWCIIHAEEEAKAMEIAASFPMSPYFQDVTCMPLMFHNSPSAALPSISLN